MKFIKIQDCPINQIYSRYISEDGTFQIGCHRVLYGVRVWAWFTGNQCLEADYCCATDPVLLARTLSICIARLEVLPNFSRENIRQALPLGNDKLFRDFDLQRELGLIS